MWSMLSPSQRDSFLGVIQNPSSELAQQLLSSMELQKERRRPWWESFPQLKGDERSTDSEQFGVPPRMISIPQTLTSPKMVSESNRFLVYNILALWWGSWRTASLLQLNDAFLSLAYAYVTRRLSSSPLSALKTSDSDHTVARDILFHISPFLLDRKSTISFKSVDDVVTYVWSRLDAVGIRILPPMHPSSYSHTQLSDTPSADSFSVLLSDAATLFQPQPVVVIQEDNIESPVSQLALLVISDIVALFSSAKVKHVLHKLNFYAAHLFTQRADVLRLVAEETLLFRLKMQSQPLVWNWHTN